MKALLNLKFIVFFSILFYGAILNLKNITNNNLESYASHSNMEIDGRSFDRNAIEMINNGYWFYTKDTYHSPGMTILISWIYKIRNSLSSVKFVNFLFWIGTLIVFYFLSKMYFFSENQSLLLVCMMSHSNLLHRYCATLQYEIIVGFFIILLLFLSLNKDSNAKNIIFPIVSSILYLFRPHLGLFIFLSNSKKKRFLPSLAIFLIIIFLITLFYSVLNNSMTISADSFSDQFHRWLNPNSKGFNYPYPEYSKPSGIDFIITYPLLYLKLMLNKLNYLFGIYPDIWFVPSRLTEYLYENGYNTDSVIAIFGNIRLWLFVLGIISILKIKKRECIYLVLFLIPIFLPHLIIGSSTRFLVPIISIVFLVQVHGIINLLKTFKYFVNKWKFRP